MTELTEPTDRQRIVRFKYQSCTGERRLYSVSGWGDITDDKDHMYCLSLYNNKGLNRNPPKWFKTSMEHSETAKLTAISMYYCINLDRLRTKYIHCILPSRYILLKHIILPDIAQAIFKLVVEFY